MVISKAYTFLVFFLLTCLLLGCEGVQIALDCLSIQVDLMVGYYHNYSHTNDLLINHCMATTGDTYNTCNVNVLYRITELKDLI